MKQYQILFQKARADLKAGKNLLEDIEGGDDELDMDAVMFHLQQSAEKLLKALLSYHRHHFTKTHNLRELLHALADHQIDIPEQNMQLIPLTYYAVEGRYAVIHDDMEDAGKYIQLLDQLLSFVEKAIEI